MRSKFTEDLPGQHLGKEVNVVDAYEMIGQVIAGAATDEELETMSRSCLPTAGACAGQYTANTMGMVAEALGLSLTGSSMLPAVFSARAPLARRAGRILMQAIINQAPLPHDIITRRSLENACAVVAATGDSTNAPRHIPAIAHEAGIRFEMDDVAKVPARTPLITDLKPGGRYLAKDVHYAGGAPVILRALLDGGYLHGDCITVTGRTIAEELQSAAAPDGQVVRKIEDALAPKVRVNAVCPALVADGFVQRLDPQLFESLAAHQRLRALLKKVGKPEDITGDVYWLAAGASPITGSVLMLDCGLHLNGDG